MTLVMSGLIRCPKCDPAWATMTLATVEDAYCEVQTGGVTHGAIPLPNDRREPPHERGQK